MQPADNRDPGVFEISDCVQIHKGREPVRKIDRFIGQRGVVIDAWPADYAWYMVDTPVGRAMFSGDELELHLGGSLLL